MKFLKLCLRVSVVNFLNHDDASTETTRRSRRSRLRRAHGSHFDAARAPKTNSNLIGATPEQSVSQRETRYRLVEDFSDFKPEGGLTLPHAYTLGFTVFSTGAPLEVTWRFNLTRLNLDQPIDPKVFVADAAEK